MSQRGKMDCCEIAVVHLIVGLRVHAQTGMKLCGFLVDVFWACELSHWFDFSGLVLVVHLGMEEGRESNLGGMSFWHSL